MERGREKGEEREGDRETGREGEKREGGRERARSSERVLVLARCATPGRSAFVQRGA